jgi:hypothetical protein
VAIYEDARERAAGSGKQKNRHVAKKNKQKLANERIRELATVKQG